MPVVKRGKKYGIGSGPAIYKTKAAAERAYKGYRASRHAGKRTSGKPGRRKK